MDTTFTIQQVADEVGLTTKTIRYYESLKIIEPAKRKSNKYREYTTLDISRLRLVKQARALGLSLGEIKPLVKHCIDGNCEQLKSSLVVHLPKYIASIQTKMDELRQLKQQLESLNSSLNSPSEITSINCKNCCSVIEEMEQINTKGSQA
ncbi:MerR family transcriptional regulator [Candidatus Curtissbacteria bacterium]|nr:MerR family transcriptional regulator [Candidatus Curtissbacteria bacterium]